MRAQPDCRSGYCRILPVFLVLLLAGCQTTPRIDWNSRVGSFSYDQAVLEMGPPDKYANLTDGSLVAEWLTARGSRFGTVQNFGPVWWGGQINESQGPDYYLRLTFAAGGKLQSWKRVAR